MEEMITGMDYKIRQVADRIRELRLISGISEEEMARRTDVTVEEYRQYESGSRNITILPKSQGQAGTKYCR